jgi:hypothetical protein
MKMDRDIADSLSAINKRAPVFSGALFVLGQGEGAEIPRGSTNQLTHYLTVTVDIPIRS